MYRHRVNYQVYNRGWLFDDLFCQLKIYTERLQTVIATMKDKSTYLKETHQLLFFL